MCFGCSRGEFSVPRGIAFEQPLYLLLEALGLDLRGDPGFDNGILEVRPGYCGECTCGQQQRDEAWSEKNSHAPTCYQTELERLVSVGEDRRAVQRLCERLGIPWNDGIGSALHCTCDYEERFVAEVGDHVETCKVVLPNLRYRPTGFELRWYKYPLRDSYMNQNLDQKAWTELFERILTEAKLGGWRAARGE